MAKLTPAQLNELVAVYVGYFNRAPDPVGLQFYIDKLEAEPAETTIDLIATNFAKSPEAIAQYPYLSTPGISTSASFITSIYQNLFNREPDAEGLEFWIDKLDNGIRTPGEMILAIIRGAVAGDDKAIIDNKIAAGLDFVTDAANTPGFVFDDEAKAAAKAALADITPDEASVAAAAAATDAFLAGAVGSTFALTTGEDNLTGTAGNDVFTALLSEADIGQRQTLNSSDLLDGGEGKDRLNATLNEGQVNTQVGDTSPTISNIEQFYIRSTGGENSLLMTGVSGAEELWNDRSVVELDFDEVQNGVAIGLVDVKDDTNVNYADGALDDDFTQTVIAQGAGTATSSVKLDVDTDDGIKELALIADSGVNNINVRGALANITDLTITGGATLMLETNSNFANIENVDATGYTGSLGLDISGQTAGADLTATLGAGDDSLTAHVETLDDEDNLATMDGGEGEDNLTLNGFSAAAQISDLDFANVSGFEQLTLDFPTIDVEDNTLDLSETEFTSLVVDGGISGTTGGTFTVIGSEDFNTITANKAVSGGSFTYEGFETLTLNANADVTAVLTAEDVVTGTLNVGEGITANVNSLNADKLVTLTVDLDDGATLNGPTQGSAKAMETVTVTGADDTTVNYFFAEEEESLATIDLSGMAGDANVGWGGDIDNTLSILVGEADLDYGFITGDTDYNASSGRETFTFTGEDIGEINIGDFTSGVGGNADRIDFSQFAAVTSLEDLDIVANGPDTVITSDAFEGTITVIGIDLTDDAANFIF